LFDNIEKEVYFTSIGHPFGVSWMGDISRLEDRDLRHCSECLLCMVRSLVNDVANLVAQEAKELGELNQLGAEHTNVNEDGSDYVVPETMGALLVGEVVIANWAGKSIHCGEIRGVGESHKELYRGALE
jgi:hypothetical protein